MRWPWPHFTDTFVLECDAVSQDVARLICDETTKQNVSRSFVRQRQAGSFRLVGDLRHAMVALLFNFAHLNELEFAKQHYFNEMFVFIFAEELAGAKFIGLLVHRGTSTASVDGDSPSIFICKTKPTSTSQRVKLFSL